MTDIATLNDNFRKTFTGGQVLLTAGIANMNSEDKANIVSLVQNFNNFNEDNDVLGEHVCPKFMLNLVSTLPLPTSANDNKVPEATSETEPTDMVESDNAE